MKNRTKYLMTALIVLIISIALNSIDVETKQERVHQHLEENWQASKKESNKGFQTHLPILMINTSGQKVPGTPLGGDLGNEMAEDGDKDIRVSMAVIDLQKGNNSLEDAPTLESLAKIRYRGNSSRHFDKKSYAMQLVFEDGSENKSEIFGMEAHNEWVINGPFLDRTLMRNYLALNLSGEIMEYSPNVRYCEMFIDGEYQGVYLFMESISKGKGRIKINKPDKNSNMTDYIIRLDREGKGNQEINDYSLYANKHADSAIDIRYPGPAGMTEGRKDYIVKDISKFEKVLYSYDLRDSEKGYSRYIDVNAFAEYFIINEFFGDSDAGRFSTFYYKNVRGKLQPAVWDFNNSCNNYIDYPKDEANFSMLDIPIFDALVKDKVFTDTVISRYRSLRKNILSEEYIEKYIDDTNLWLGDAVDRNYEKWGYVFDLSNYDGMNFLTPVDRNYTSYEDSVDQLKDYLEKRGKWLDRNITTLYQYSHESRNINELLK